MHTLWASINVDEYLKTDRKMAGNACFLEMGVNGKESQGMNVRL